MWRWLGLLITQKNTQTHSKPGAFPWQLTFKFLPLFWNINQVYKAIARFKSFFKLLITFHPGFLLDNGKTLQFLKIYIWKISTIVMEVSQVTLINQFWLLSSWQRWIQMLWGRSDQGSWIKIENVIIFFFYVLCLEAGKVELSEIELWLPQSLGLSSL